MKFKSILLTAFFMQATHAFEQITSLEQLRTKITQNSAVIVKIYREDCPPCRQLAPVLRRFSEKCSSYHFFEVNSSQARDIVAAYDIKKVPTILYFFNGQLKGKDTGAQSYTALEKRAQELLQ